MPETTPEAVSAAASAIRDQMRDSRDIDPDEMARAAMEAAAPILAETILTPLAKRHVMIPSDWGGLCGTCWNQDGSRAAWPCAELLAIAALLPESAEVPHA